MGTRKKKKPLPTLSGINWTRSVVARSEFARTTETMRTLYDIDPATWVRRPLITSSVIGSGIFMTLDSDESLPKIEDKPKEEQQSMLGRLQTLLQEHKGALAQKFREHEEQQRIERKKLDQKLRGRYRERLKALTDENIELKYELNKLKAKK